MDNYIKVKFLSKRCHFKLTAPDSVFRHVLKIFVDWFIVLYVKLEELCISRNVFNSILSQLNVLLLCTIQLV